MLLPHEICWALGKWNKDAGTEPFTADGLTHSARQCFLNYCQAFDKDVTKTMPLGFWVDGVPVKWDRSESVIVLTLNFPGQVLDQFRQLRIPLTIINKKFLVDETMADILHIIAWSFVCLHEGFFPASPLPGQDPFTGWGFKHRGQALHVGGMLLEIRGDWEAYKNFFGFFKITRTVCGNPVPTWPVQ